MKEAGSSLAMRRAALVEQIERERDQLLYAWHRTQQRVQALDSRIAQIQALMRNPAFLAAALVGAWAIGWRRSAAIVRNAALVWSAWQQIGDR
jgi:alkylation response protein AidB-like acyl-CoA dehydrogenase